MSSASAPEEQADALLQRARALLDLGRPAEAVPLAAEAIRLNPDSVQSYCYLGLALMNAGELKQALAALEDAIRHAPNYEWPHRLRSIALQTMGDKQNSLRAAEEAHRLSPDAWQTVHTLADALLGAQQLAKAGEVAERLKTLAPDDADTFDILGRIALAGERLLEAELHLREALKLDPGNASTHNNLGVTLLNQGRVKEAMQFFHSALTADPRVRNAQGNLYLSAKRFLSQHVFGSSKQLLEQISPTVYRYFRHKEEWSFKAGALIYFLFCFLPIVGVLALIAALNWLKGDSPDPFSYFAVGVALNGAILILIGLNWGRHRFRLLADHIPWLAPMVGVIVSPLVFVLIGIFGLAFDPPRGPFYVLAIIGGVVFTTAMIGRKLRGRYYSALARWYPYFDRTRARWKQRLQAVIGNRWVYPFWWTLRNPLTYVVLGAAGMVREAPEADAILWLLVMSAGVVFTGIRLMRYFSRR